MSSQNSKPRYLLSYDHADNLHKWMETKKTSGNPVLLVECRTLAELKIKEEVPESGFFIAP